MKIMAQLFLFNIPQGYYSIFALKWDIHTLFAQLNKIMQNKNKAEIGSRTNIINFYNLGMQLVNSGVIFKFTHPYMSTACCLYNWSSSSIGKVLGSRNFLSWEWSSPRYLCGSFHPGFWSERATRGSFLDHTL